MNIKLNDRVAIENFRYRVTYNFMLNAHFSRGLGLSTQYTYIDRTYFDEAGDPVSGDDAASFIDGKWVFHEQYRK